jgi:hypothetical protein
MERDFDKLVAVSGLPGLYQMVANRPNGLIVEDLDEGKRRFAPSRKHQFTPLASIGIYTDDGETIELSKVFQMINAKKEEVPVAELDDGSDVLRAYFAEILPNYDRDQVYVSDIKKVIKWFTFLEERNLLPAEKEDSSEEE